jgi:hypothetical protein
MLGIVFSWCQVFGVSVGITSHVTTLPDSLQQLSVKKNLFFIFPEKNLFFIPCKKITFFSKVKTFESRWQKNFFLLF